MGYDVTFHPFDKLDFKFYIENVIEQPDKYIKQVMSLHSSEDERNHLRGNIYSKFEEMKTKVLSDSENYENTIGLGSAAILGYLHPYWYSRGGLLSNLSDSPHFANLFGQISSIVDLKNKVFFDKASNAIASNYSSGVYVQSENILGLLESLLDPANSEIVELHIGQSNIPDLESCLKYCLVNKLGLLEATDVVVPISGNNYSYPKNLRASYLKNTDNYINDAKNSKLKPTDPKKTTRLWWEIWK